MASESVVRAKAVYGVIQFAWTSCFFITPNSSALILRIQRAALILDIVFFASDCYDIAAELYQKATYPISKKEEGKRWYHYPYVAVVAIAGAVSLPIIAGIGVICINYFHQPVFRLNEIGGTSSHDADLKINWCTPHLQWVSQCIFLMRIIANFVLSRISPQSGLYYCSFFLQSCSLYNISCLHWVQVEKSIKGLFRHVVGEKAETSSLNGNIVFQFFVPDKIDPLRSAIKSIYDYMQTCLESREIMGDWADGKIKGYQLSIRPPTFTDCKLFLDRVFGIGVDSKAGVVPITVWTNLKT